MVSNKPPTLTDARGLGGIIAQDGFDYQLWDGLLRLPSWLANPAFDQLLFEGFEDLEARFFTPYASQQYLLERYQAKSAVLTPLETTNVFDNFLALEAAAPNHTRLYSLVTPQLAPTLKWLSRDADRVRQARPFYAPFPAVMVASDAKLKDDLTKQFGSTIGEFVADFVEVFERQLPNRESAILAFGLALDRAFPELDAGAASVERTFEALSGLARRHIGVPLKRSELTKVLEDALGKSISLKAFPVLIRSDRNESDERSLEIDARSFSGGKAGFPREAAWTADLLGPLGLTAKWLRSAGVSRISISGSYRLTTAFVMGWSFRSAIGFELELPTRDGAWATDDRPGSGDALPDWRIIQPSVLTVDRLVVCVGVLRDPRLELRHLPENAILSFFLDAPVTSGRMAQRSVSLIKHEVDSAARRLNPKAIDFYFAGPAALAGMLGHRWNAMPRTQLHEYVAESRLYLPTAAVAHHP